MTLGPVGTVAQALTTPSTRISMTHFLSIAHLRLLRWRGGHWPPASRALLDIWVVATRIVAIVPRCLWRGGLDDHWGWRLDNCPHLRHPARAPLSLPLGLVQGIFDDPTAARLPSEARPLFPLFPAHAASMHSPPLLLLFWGEQFADVLHRGDAGKAELSLFAGDILEHVFHFR